MATLTNLTIAQILNHANSESPLRGSTDSLPRRDSEQLNQIISQLDSDTITKLAKRTYAICLEKKYMTKIYIPWGDYAKNPIYMAIKQFLNPPPIENERQKRLLELLDDTFINTYEISFGKLHCGNHHPILIKLFESLKNTQYPLNGFLETRFIPEGYSYSLPRGCHGELIVDIVKGTLEEAIIPEGFDDFWEELKVKYKL
jgi:hypothetical protein